MGARQAVALGGAAIGALAALNSALATTPKPPESPTPGRNERYAWSEGSIHYTVDGVGQALVLVHGIGLAASSFEMRYLAEPLARHFRVYTLDLLGFGLSDRPGIRYTADLYVTLIEDFLREVVRDNATLIAAGLSANYCAEVARRQPERVPALVFSAPPLPEPMHGRAGAAGQVADLLLEVPILGQTIFNGLTTRGGIRTYLRERAYSNPALVTEAMVDAQFAMARQPNARQAAGAYLAGRLDLRNPETIAALRQRLLLVFGAQSYPAPAEQAAAYARLNPRADVLLLERCGALPHEEQAEAFAGAAEAWLGIQS